MHIYRICVSVLNNRDMLAAKCTKAQILFIPRTAANRDSTNVNPWSVAAALELQYMHSPLRVVTFRSQSLAGGRLQ
jgi:hypothetical protein